MNEELYEKLEVEFAKRHIDKKVEDVLLDIAEMLADKNVLGKEISCKKTIGRTLLEAVDFCEADEEYPDKAGVYIKTLTVAGTVYEIEDYLL